MSTVNLTLVATPFTVVPSWTVEQFHQALIAIRIFPPIGKLAILIVAFSVKVNIKLLDVLQLTAIAPAVDVKVVVPLEA